MMNVLFLFREGSIDRPTQSVFALGITFTKSKKSNDELVNK